MKVEVQPILDYCNDVISHEEFAMESDEVLKSFFEQESVVHIHWLCRKVDGIFVPSSTLILTFDRSILNTLWILELSSVAVYSKSLALSQVPVVWTYS